MWCVRYNGGLCVLYKEPDITKVGGQLLRLDGVNPHWKLTYTRLECARKRQRPSVSSLDVTEQHPQILRIKSLKDRAQVA